MVKLVIPMMMFSLCPESLASVSFLHSLSGQLTAGGHSGMKTKSASETIAATMARYPQCLPMTSMMNVLWWECAVGMMQSTASMIR